MVALKLEIKFPVLYGNTPFTYLHFYMFLWPL